MENASMDELNSILFMVKECKKNAEIITEKYKEMYNFERGYLDELDELDLDLMEATFNDTIDFISNIISRNVRRGIWEMVKYQSSIWQENNC